MTPKEPSADPRLLASILRQTYMALLAEGFTQQEALTIIGHMLAANRPDPT